MGDAHHMTLPWGIQWSAVYCTLRLLVHTAIKKADCTSTSTPLTLSPSCSHTWTTNLVAIPWKKEETHDIWLLNKWPRPQHYIATTPATYPVPTLQYQIPRLHSMACQWTLVGQPTGLPDYGLADEVIGTPTYSTASPCTSILTYIGQQTIDKWSKWQVIMEKINRLR